MSRPWKGEVNAITGSARLNVHDPCSRALTAYLATIRASSTVKRKKAAVDAIHIVAAATTNAT
jgi:hypothetical protein